GVRRTHANYRRPQGNSPRGVVHGIVVRPRKGRERCTRKARRGEYGSDTRGEGRRARGTGRRERGPDLSPVGGAGRKRRRTRRTPCGVANPPVTQSTPPSAPASALSRLEMTAIRIAITNTPPPRSPPSGPRVSPATPTTTPRTTASTMPPIDPPSSPCHAPLKK